MIILVFCIYINRSAQTTSQANALQLSTLVFLSLAAVPWVR
jgi:hypothetical protein